jgi:hypothetical protein
LIASAGFSEAAIPAAIYTTDAQGKITFFNQAAEAGCMAGNLAVVRNGRARDSHMGITVHTLCVG